MCAESLRHWMGDQCGRWSWIRTVSKILYKLLRKELVPHLHPKRPRGPSVCATFTASRVTVPQDALTGPLSMSYAGQGCSSSKGGSNIISYQYITHRQTLICINVVIYLLKQFALYWIAVLSLLSCSNKPGWKAAKTCYAISEQQTLILTTCVITEW